MILYHSYFEQLIQFIAKFCYPVSFVSFPTVLCMAELICKQSSMELDADWLKHAAVLYLSRVDFQDSQIWLETF